MLLSQILKLYAWEKSFIRKVEFLRKQEARLMYIYVLVCSVFSFVWNCLPFLVSSCVSSNTFAKTCVLMRCQANLMIVLQIAGTVIGSYLLLNKENELSPKKVLVSIALFSQLRYQLAAFPYVISLLVKMSVSLKRIKEFLLCEEVDTTAVTELVQEGEYTQKRVCKLLKLKQSRFAKMRFLSDESVNINNATFKWNLEEEKPPLANINLSIKNGELFAVVGKVAAGKSSLIQAILGELYVTSGSVNRRNVSDQFSSGIQLIHLHGILVYFEMNFIFRPKWRTYLNKRGFSMIQSETISYLVRTTIHRCTKWF